MSKISNYLIKLLKEPEYSNLMKEGNFYPIYLRLWDDDNVNACKEFTRLLESSGIDIADYGNVIPMGYHYNDCNLREITLSEGITSIDTAAFYACENLTKVGLPGSLQTIRDHAFEDCTKLQSIKLPPKLDSIYLNAFAGCSNMVKIFIPKSVQYIDAEAFAGCSNLTIACEAEAEPDEWAYTWNVDSRPVYWGVKELI